MERVPWAWWIVIVLTLSVHILFGALPPKVRSWQAAPGAVRIGGADANEPAASDRGHRSIPLLQVAVLLVVIAFAFARREPPRERVAVATMVAGATLMRLLLLDGEINGDEAATFHDFIAPGVMTALAHYPAPNNHVLYSVTMAALYWLAPSALVLRLATVLISSLAVVGMHRFMQRLERPLAERLLATLIVATATSAVRFAVQMRGYGPLLATAPFVLDSYLVSVACGSLQAWRRFALLAAIACGWHLFGVFLVLALLAHGAVLCVFRRIRTMPFLYAAAAWGACLLALHALALPGMRDYFAHKAGAEHYRGFDRAGVYGLLFGSGLASWCVIALCAAGIWSSMRARRWTQLWMATGPLLLALAFCTLFKTFVFGRFFLFAYPGIVLLLATALGFVTDLAASSRQTILRWCMPLAGLVVAALTSWNLPVHYLTPTIASQLTQVVRDLEPETIYVAGQHNPLFQFYLGSCEVVREPAQLRAPENRHVVVRDTRQKSTGEDLARRTALDAFLDEHYRIVWRPGRDPSNINSALRGVQVLVHKGSGSPR